MATSKSSNLCVTHPPVDGSNYLLLRAQHNAFTIVKPSFKILKASAVAEQALILDFFKEHRK